MKTQSSVPTTKVARASQFMKAGVKVGGNYIKHYSKKLLDPNRSKEELHKDNAADIYDALSELKGSALKMAQMLSMDRGLLPGGLFRQVYHGAVFGTPAFGASGGQNV
jgi:predicted unusual protein kinase regulating ubiquinone biosynthesis (AarF/ABC1/UbiB family)